jgi:hypothetical protein
MRSEKTCRGACRLFLAPRKVPQVPNSLGRKRAGSPVERASRWRGGGSKPKLKAVTHPR